MLVAPGALVGPFVGLLSAGLESARVPVVTHCLKCLCFLVPLKLQEVTQEAETLCRRVFDMMQGTTKTSSALVQDGFKLVAALIRACPSFKVSDDHLKYLLAVAFVVRAYSPPRLFLGSCGCERGGRSRGSSGVVNLFRSRCVGYPYGDGIE